MGATSKIDRKALDSLLSKVTAAFRKNVLTALQKLGEECIVRVRDRSQETSWYDHTTNLRSSIGYAIYDEGVKYAESTFATIGGGTKGTEKGKKMVDSLAKEFVDVFALVVIAGMNYASYVEKLENKDVLESCRLWAMSIIDKRLNRTVEETVKSINTWEL